MRVSYYPGCSLEATARDYRESLEYVCRQLGIELAEVEDWGCCGATAAHSTDEFLSLALPARNLALAEQAGLNVVVPFVFQPAEDHGTGLEDRVPARCSSRQVQFVRISIFRSALIPNRFMRFQMVTRETRRSSAASD
jgi:hypothetical protein